MKILAVDDDPHIGEPLAVSLQLQWADAEVLVAVDGDAALRSFYAHELDLVLLDLVLPLRNGFEVLREVRQVSDIPVIVLTGRREEADQVRALELGADDYIIKPFGHLALVARIKAVLRRTELPPPARGLPDFVAGALVVHFERQVVTLRGEPVPLTPVEYRLLYQLVRNAGHVLPHQALLDRVWGGEHDATNDHLKVFISRLRAKLEPPEGPHYIETERGVGYRFVRPRGSGPTDPPTSLGRSAL